MAGNIFIRFYEELNDFLPERKRKKEFEHTYFGQPSIKDIVESLGIPHTEIDMILANGQSVNFNYKPGNREHISVYPVFESFDISNISHLRPKPLRETKFILDVHLGKLARYLRMLGFDSLYENNYSDQQIIDISVKEKRIILTRDLGILKNSTVTHGYWLRSQNPKKQLSEVVNRLDLADNIKPLYRCMKCNGIIEKVDKNDIINQLQPKTKKYFNEFFRCSQCKKVYWKGSHYEKMKKSLSTLTGFSLNKKLKNKY